MGGQNASIVLADADVEAAAAMIAGAAMGYAGQKCTATGRVVCEARDAVPLRRRWWPPSRRCRWATRPTRQPGRPA